MLTLRLNDATELHISDAGFQTSVIRLNDIVTNAVTFTTVDTALMNVQAYFKDTEKTSVMSVLNEEGTPVSTMNGYTALQAIQVNLDGDDTYYTVTMAQPTDLEGMKSTMKSMMDTMTQTTEEAVKKVETLGTDLTSAKNELTQKITTATQSIEKINEQIAPPNPEEMELDELKAYRVAESKLNLAAWLADHPIQSTAHKGTLGTYSVTSEKQNLLQSAIMVAQFQKAAGNDEYTPSWNETGKECEYDWTLEELTKLALEISAYVAPYVSAQQSKETKIMAAKDADAVNAISLTYEDVHTAVMHV